jgi:hypothetical protein
VYTYMFVNIKVACITLYGFKHIVTYKCMHLCTYINTFDMDMYSNFKTKEYNIHDNYNYNKYE